MISQIDSDTKVADAYFLAVFMAPFGKPLTTSSNSIERKSELELLTEGRTGAMWAADDFEVHVGLVAAKLACEVADEGPEAVSVSEERYATALGDLMQSSVQGLCPVGECGALEKMGPHELAAVPGKNGPSGPKTRGVRWAARARGKRQAHAGLRGGAAANAINHGRHA